MTNPPARIENAEAVISHFGYWPSFHDAEVLEVSLSRDGTGPGRPSMSVAIHAFEMTSQVKPSGHYVCHKHVTINLSFEDLGEISFDGFNHQNALSKLHIAESEPNGFISVVFEGAYGIDASLTCRAVRVVSVVLGIPDGSVYSSEKA